jgi:hypothetical protein
MFKHHIIDLDLDPVRYAQTCLADIDGDGRLEFIMGQQYGTLYWYKFQAPDQWTRHILGTDSPSDVGGCVLDVDGDGRIDYVAGGAWYRNTGDPAQPFERHVFDRSLEGVHDVQAADIDGDGRMEIVTMSDQNDLRWYKIPTTPTQPWPHTVIGPAVHAGVAIGDLDGDGSLDIVRTNVWFENVNGDGSRWQVRPIGPNTYPPEDFRPYFAYDGVRAVVCDMNKNGKNDIVFTDAEIPGGRVWWMENVDGAGHYWRRHEIAGPTGVRRGAYHTLYVGDLDGDGDLDVFSCEMEAVRGDAPPRYYIWENVDGVGGEWREHVILDANLGGHEAVVGDITGNGLPDIIAKPWGPHPDNAVNGKMFVVFLENVGGGW